MYPRVNNKILILDDDHGGWWRWCVRCMKCRNLCSVSQSYYSEIDENFICSIDSNQKLLTTLERHVSMCACVGVMGHEGNEICSKHIHYPRREDETIFNSIAPSTHAHTGTLITASYPHCVSWYVEPILKFVFRRSVGPCVRDIGMVPGCLFAPIQAQRLWFITV